MVISVVKKGQFFRWLLVWFRIGSFGWLLVWLKEAVLGGY